jgi:hypothetical protein
MSVQIPGLPVASVADDGDTTIIRQGLTDKQVTIDKVRTIDISLFPTLPNGSAVASDLFMIRRASSNYQIRFDQVGFPAGTLCWFYQNVAPDGWLPINFLGDCVLALRGGLYGPAGNTVAGTWQQSDATLNINQIPNHTHNIICGKNTTNSGVTHTKGTEDENPSPRPRAPTEGITGSSNGIGSSQPHNHGASWRPLAVVGILCQKQA